MARFGIAGLVVCLTALTGMSDEPKKPDEKGDTRVLWVYEGGWFAKSKDGSWYEMNESIFRGDGKPHKFGEAKRTKDFIDLNDETRRVYVRLHNKHVELLTRKGDWEKLFEGRWKAP